MSASLPSGPLVNLGCVIEVHKLGTSVRTLISEANIYSAQCEVLHIRVATNSCLLINYLIPVDNTTPHFKKV